MKISEFKLKIQNGLGSLIDTYFGSNSISDKFINATLKILVKQNIHKYDNRKRTRNTATQRLLQ